MALYIISTPIGNLEDITIRALKILFSCPTIIAEDTRHTGNLIDFYRKKPDLLTQIFGKDLPPHKPRFISLYDQVEAQRLPLIIDLLKQGQDVALVSDAGTPLISDPGFKVVRAAIRENIRVVPIPGPSAVTASLVASGMPPGKFLFLGYLPPRQRRRRKELSQLQQALQPLRHQPTIIVYEAPHRMFGFLQDVLDIAGNVEMVIAQELTKIHEQVQKKSVSLWLAELTQKPSKFKGEFTVLFQFSGDPKIANAALDEDDDDTDEDE